MRLRSPQPRPSCSPRMLLHVTRGWLKPGGGGGRGGTALGRESSDSSRLQGWGGGRGQRQVRCGPPDSVCGSRAAGASSASLPTQPEPPPHPHPCRLPSPALPGQTSEPPPAQTSEPPTSPGPGPGNGALQTHQIFQATCVRVHACVFVHAHVCPLERGGEAPCPCPPPAPTQGCLEQSLRSVGAAGDARGSGWGWRGSHRWDPPSPAQAPPFSNNVPPQHLPTGKPSPKGTSGVLPSTLELPPGESQPGGQGGQGWSGPASQCEPARTLPRSSGHPPLLAEAWPWAAPTPAGGQSAGRRGAG